MQNHDIVSVHPVFLKGSIIRRFLYRQRNLFPVPVRLHKKLKTGLYTLGAWILTASLVIIKKPQLIMFINFSLIDRWIQHLDS